MERTLRRSKVPGEPGASEAPGFVYAIVPAHGGSNADSVAKNLSRELAEGSGLSVLLADFCSHGFPVWNSSQPAQRFDGHTWGAVVILGEPFDRLQAREADPRNISRVLQYARTRYNVTCVDLSESSEPAALEVLRNADSIFLVANSDYSSVEQARYRASWLRSMDLEERTALFSNRVAGGASGAEAEDRTGLPVCAALSTAHDLRRLAEWLAAPLPTYQNAYSQPA